MISEAGIRSDDQEAEEVERSAQQSTDGGANERHHGAAFVKDHGWGNIDQHLDSLFSIRVDFYRQGKMCSHGSFDPISIIETEIVF